MRWMLLAVLTLEAATCGQKGPLNLPEEPAPAAAAAVLQLEAPRDH